MNNNFEYNKNTKIAQIGSEICLNYLCSRKNLSRITDLQDSKYGRDNNVDFSYIKNMNKEWILELAEVKCDMVWWSGNICFETKSNEGKKTKGCFLATKSNVWLHTFPHNKKMILVKTKEVRDWFNENIARFKEVSCNTTDRNEKYLYTTVSRLVPLNVLLKEMNKYSVEIAIPEKWMPQWTYNFLIGLDEENKKKNEENKKKKYVNEKWHQYWESNENKNVLQKH